MTYSPTPTERLALKTANAALLNSLDPWCDIVSTVVFALGSAQLLQSPETATELERLRLLLNAQPVELTEEQRDALSDAGNRALNDHYHEDLCFCRDWPESCATAGYFPGMWDTGAFDIGLSAVLGLWEAMRAERPLSTGAELQSRELSAALAELKTLRARAAELENATCAHCSCGHAPECPYGECPSCGAPADATGTRIPLHRVGCPLDVPVVPAEARQLEDPHESPLHHDYALGHDLPARADLPESLR